MPQIYLHFTNVNNILSVNSTGLQPKHDRNSSIIKDDRSAVCFSEGVEGAIHMIVSLCEEYGLTKEEIFTRLERDSDVYRSIVDSSDFEEWTSNEVYLAFSGRALSEHNVSGEPHDMRIYQSIQSGELKVCVVIDKKKNRIISADKMDVMMVWLAKRKNNGQRYYYRFSFERLDEIKRYCTQPDIDVGFVSLSDFIKLYNLDSQEPHLLTEEIELEGVDVVYDIDESVVSHAGDVLGKKESLVEESERLNGVKPKTYFE